jgi:ABC-2 type transport system ATP-binding protein
MVVMSTGNDTDSVMLAVDGLTKSYGDRRVVDGLSFRVGVGETLGLLGPNGSGKTTTISMIAGVLAADSGSITIAGEPMSATGRAAKRHVGLVPQDIALYDDLSAVENLRFFGRLHGLGRRQLNQRIDDVLDIVGLSDRRNDRVGEFSGGMQRRANIAAGMLHEPSLLILDEPTVGVDPQSRNQILDAVAELGGSGLSVIYTTHYMEEAERLCDRVCIIDEGRLLATGTQAELLAQSRGEAKNLEEVFLHLTGRRVRD